jgi:hypothetical protein
MARGKIITTLRQRREIEQQIRDLVALKAPDEIERHIAAILAHGDTLIPTLLANLDTAEPHFRGALGLIAARLPAENIAPALRSLAADSGQPDQARLTAVMILERYLGESIEPGILTGLDDPREIALQSLREVVSESAKDRAILAEYARSFGEQPDDVASVVLDALELIPPEDQPDLLRVLAQDERVFVRDGVLALLGRNRTPAAGRALQILLPTAPAALQPIIQRSLRKRNLAGGPVEPLPPLDPTWRVLASPLDGQGTQSIWFLQERAGQEECRFLSVLINDQHGIKDAFGGDHIQGQHFPAAAPLGVQHAVPLHESSLTLHLLEASFDYGRRRILAGLKINAERRNPTPVEYRLLNDFLWGYQLDDGARTPQLPEMDEAGARLLLPRTMRLLDLPDFTTWFMESESLLAYAERVRALASTGGAVSVPRPWIAELAGAHFESAERRALYAARLDAMSEWLLLGGHIEPARLARAAALTMDGTPPAEHPFLLRLAQIGLGVAISALSHGMHLRMGRPGED